MAMVPNRAGDVLLGAPTMSTHERECGSEPASGAANLSVLELLLADDMFVPTLQSLNWNAIQPRHAPACNLVSLVNAFGVATEHQWAHLERHFGVDASLASDRLGRGGAGGTSAGIAARCRLRIIYNLEALSGWLDRLEMQLALLSESRDLAQVVDLQVLMDELIATGWEEVSASSCSRLLTVITVLRQGCTESRSVRRRYPVLVRIAEGRNLRASALASPVQTEYVGMTYRAMAIQVLKEAGKPLHYQEIVDRAIAANMRLPVIVKQLQKKLEQDEDFKRVGRGIYTLSAQGKLPEDAYSDIIFDVLCAAGGVLSLAKLHRGVIRLRPMTVGFLVQCLADSPRFFKAMNGWYGLRVCLPKWQRQRHAVPDYLIELPRSSEGLVRVEARGDAIAEILERDRAAVAAANIGTNG